MVIFHIFVKISGDLQSLQQRAGHGHHEQPPRLWWRRVPLPHLRPRRGRRCGRCERQRPGGWRAGNGGDAGNGGGRGARFGVRGGGLGCGEWKPGGNLEISYGKRWFPKMGDPKSKNLLRVSRFQQRCNSLTRSLAHSLTHSLDRNTEGAWTRTSNRQLRWTRPHIASNAR